jgi:hypothetical protein
MVRKISETGAETAETAEIWHLQPSRGGFDGFSTKTVRTSGISCLQDMRDASEMPGAKEDA